MRHFKTKLYSSLLMAPLLLGTLLLAGCETDRKLLEVETPNGELNIEQDSDTGGVEVQIDN